MPRSASPQESTGIRKNILSWIGRNLAAIEGSNSPGNLVCPSGLEMPSIDRLGLLGEEQMARRREAMGRMSPLGRICSPDDVADAILFLSGSGSSFMTGVALPVEGGGTMALRF